VIINFSSDYGWLELEWGDEWPSITTARKSGPERTLRLDHKPILVPAVPPALSNIINSTAIVPRLLPVLTSSCPTEGK